MAKFYRCNKCGNFVGLIKEGAGQLVCCGEPMEEVKANIVDAATEKHVPVLDFKNGILHVKVGSTEHPMTDKHYIEWIYIKCDGFAQRKIFTPEMKPEADFCVKDVKNIEVYAYCNLHGLWKAEV